MVASIGMISTDSCLFFFKKPDKISFSTSRLRNETWAVCPKAYTLCTPGYFLRLKAEGYYIGLSQLPRNSASIRMHNRCKLTGRPKGYMRQFGVSRIQFREMASAGLIPGIKKASW